MNIKKDNFVIVEIIPSNTYENGGMIVQISALKIKDLKLDERLDVRLCDKALPFPEMKRFIDYDNEEFTILDNEKDLLKALKDFCRNYPLLILDEIYTPSFLNYLDNDKECILNYLNLHYHKNIIDEIMTKYHLEPSNHIVDLLYEALMMEY